LQVDPIGYGGGNHLYAYVNNDPLNLTDPSGFCVEDACVVEGAAACAAIPACSGAVAALVVGTAYYAGKAIDFLANTVSSTALTRQSRLGIDSLGVNSLSAADSAAIGSTYGAAASAINSLK
jgi:uncharacterized protein RhaS with RHS repeats